MKLLLAAYCTVAFLATNCLSQEADEKANNQEPPKLQLAFSDDFSKDSRDDYTVKGDVIWEKGRLQLVKGASITRKIKGGAWAKVELGLEPPALTKEEPEFELHVWFILDGATNCYVRLRQKLSDGSLVGSVALVDTGEKNGKPIEQVVRQAVLKDRNFVELSVEYRNGLVLVLADNRPLLTAYISNRTATVATIKAEAANATVLLSLLAVRTVEHDVNELSEQEKQQLADAETANNELIKFHQQGKFAEAVEVGEKVLQIRASVLGEIHFDYAVSLNNLAMMYQTMGDYPRAEPLYKQAVDIGKSVLGEKHPDYAGYLYNLATLYYSMGDYPRAEPLYKQAMDSTKSALGEKHPEYAGSLNALSALFYSMGDYPRAAPLLKQAMDIRKSALGEKHPEYATSLNNLAWLYQNMGDYARAEPLHKQAMDITKSALGEKHPEYATSLNYLALLYKKMGDYARAEPLYNRALEIRKSVLGEKHPAYAGNLHNLAALYETMGDYARAEPLFKQAMDITKSALGEGHPDYAVSLNALAQLYISMGDYARAELRHKQAMDIRKSVLGEKHPAYAVSLNNLAGLYYSMGDYGRAEPLFKEAMAIRKLVLGDKHPNYVGSLYNLAQLYDRIGDYARAEPLIRHACDITHENLDDSSMVQSERQQKRNQSKRQHYIDSRLGIALRGGAPASDVLQAVWQWKGAVSFRQQAYRRVASNPKLAPSFDSLQSVSRQLSAISGRNPVPPKKGATEAAHTTYEQKRKRWEQQFSLLNQQREDLEQRIAADSAEFRELREFLAVVAVQKLLPADTAFVDFLGYSHRTPDPERKGKTIYERRYIAFVVRKDREPKMIGLGPINSLHEAINAFRQPFAVEHNTPANREAARKAGRLLREELWAYIEKHLDGIETVIVSPDTALGTLPWAALPGRKANSFLLEDYKLASVPFANLLPRLMRDQSSASSKGGLLVLGDVDYDSKAKSRSDSESNQLIALASEQGRLNRTRGDKTGKWTSLPGFREELETVKLLQLQRFGADSRISILSGTNATENSLLQTASQYNTLHLITHGYFEDPNVMSIDQAEIKRDASSSPTNGPDPFINTWLPGLLSGLVMAGANRPSDDPQDLNDGILRASEIETASLQGVDLVVLSACETGLGVVAGGEGLTGLQRAFQIAGARTVVASLWKVEDRATQELMRRFYENLWIKKMSKIDALREAQLWMLRHPKELEAMGIKNATTRGKPRDLKPIETQPAHPDTDGKTDPYFWAAFQLSGDWR